MLSFVTLPYREQLLRLQHLVEEVLPHYDLHGVQYTLLQYDDNAVYQIISQRGEHFVLRISAAEGHSPVAQRSEMQWLMALRHGTNLRVPEPIPNHTGDLVTIGVSMEVLEPRTCVLLHWVPGDPPAQGIHPMIAERIGAFTAQLHRHAEHFAPSTSTTFIRPSWDWEQLFGASSVPKCADTIISLAPHQQEILSAVSTQMQRALSLLGRDASVWGLIHADLHRDNILLHNGEVGVIDFDDCGWGYYLLDLASVLDSFFRRVVNQPKDYLQLREAYLIGYDRVRALPAALDADLRIFKVMRDIITVNFILNSKNANVQTWGRQRVDHILAQLEAFLEGSSAIGI